MMLGDMAARVVAVLTRAESLFAVPEDAAAASAAADQLGQAADANRALGGRAQSSPVPARPRIDSWSTIRRQAWARRPGPTSRWSRI
jgi:hypothetical protein